jgi:hypothetical protein
MAACPERRAASRPTEAGKEANRDVLAGQEYRGVLLLLIPPRSLADLNVLERREPAM